MPGKILSRFADTVGDGSGTLNANGDYEGDPTMFMVTAQPDEYISLARMIVTVQDAGINSFDVYAGAGELAVGLHLYVTDNGGNIVYHLCDPNQPVTRLAEWAHYCFDAQVLDATSGDDHFVARWTFAKSGIPVTLWPGWSLIVLCEDDLTDLTEHHFLLQGYFIDRTHRATGEHA